jgi:hypothetical protein
MPYYKLEVNVPAYLHECILKKAPCDMEIFTSVVDGKTIHQITFEAKNNACFGYWDAMSYLRSAMTEHNLIPRNVAPSSLIKPFYHKVEAWHLVADRIQKDGGDILAANYFVLAAGELRFESSVGLSDTLALKLKEKIQANHPGLPVSVVINNEKAVLSIQVADMKAWCENQDEVTSFKP